MLLRLMLVRMSRGWSLLLLLSQNQELRVGTLVLVQVVPITGVVVPERVVQVSALGQIPLELAVALHLVAA